MPLKKTTLPRTAEEVALAELRQAIVRGDLPPGAPIKQDATAQELGLSVVPVREALKTLAGEGIVAYRPQRGYMVAELHPDSVDGVFRVRDLLEGEAERIAVGRIRPEGLVRMRTAQEEHYKAVKDGDAVRVIMSNRSFHFELFDLCGNALLLRLVRQTWDSLDPHRALSYRRAMARSDVRRYEQIAGEHQAIVARLEAGDPDGAAQLLAEHRIGGQEAFHHYLLDKS